LKNPEYTIKRPLLSAFGHTGGSSGVQNFLSRPGEKAHNTLSKKPIITK
jgi:hypothetical protein